MKTPPVTFQGDYMMDNATEIRKARKEWDTLIWKKAILQTLKRQGFDPDFVKKLENSFNSSRKQFINRYGKFVEWI